MAGLRKLRGKWYVRVFLPGGREKLIPTKTGDRKRAEAMKRQIEEREFLVKARLAEDLFKVFPTLKESIENYLKDCTTRLRSGTVRSYRLALGHLMKCWGNPRLADLTPRHIARIREYLVARHEATTVNDYLRPVRCFLNWCVETELIDRFPGKFRLVKEDESLPKFFLPDELKSIFSVVENPKMLATFKVLADTGLRPGELANCTLEGTHLHLRQTKNRRDRLVPISPGLIPDVLLAIDEPYKSGSVSRSFFRAIRKAGIPKNGRSLYCLRHTFAVREYARTRDIYYVKGLLGHSTVTTTEKYAAYPEEYLRQVFGNQDPVVQAIQAATSSDPGTKFEV